jgi:hypothetical protein
MKAALAILFSALVALTQGVLPVDAAVAKAPACCTRCACGSPCCVATPNSDSAPLPAAPAPQVSLKQSQCALIVAALVLSPLVSPAPKISPSVSSPRSNALPLYERNCVYLI